jgi:protein gp37
MTDKTQPFFNHLLKPWTDQGVATRRTLSIAKHNQSAKLNGRRERVLVDIDVFKAVAPEKERANLWDFIDATPHLDWLLLTDYPENIERLWPFGWYDDQMSWPNIWLGVRVQTQLQANARMEWLLSVPTPNLLVYFDLHTAVDLEECGVIEAAGEGEGGYNSNVAWIIATVDKKRKRNAAYMEMYLSLKEQWEMVSNTTPLWVGAGKNAAWPIPLEGEVYRQFPECDEERQDE